MWIFIRDGFFSVAATKFCGPGEVAIRARRKEHLENLMSRHGLTAEILCFKNADYRYRIHIPRDEWGTVLQEEAGYIDYESLIDAMAATDASADYLRAMSATWAIVQKIQTDELPPG
jgi:hypothetical protein